MNAVAPHATEKTAIHTQLGTIFISLELSRSTWLVTSLSPGGGEKMSKHSCARAMSRDCWNAFRPSRKKCAPGLARPFRSLSFRRPAWLDRMRASRWSDRI